MTNGEALDLLGRFATEAQTAAQAAVWAEAFLTYGGEATWDAVKSVAWCADTLASLSEQVLTLTERFNEIAPF